MTDQDTISEVQVQPQVKETDLKADIPVEVPTVPNKPKEGWTDVGKKWLSGLKTRLSGLFGKGDSAPDTQGGVRDILEEVAEPPEGLAQESLQDEGLKQPALDSVQKLGIDEQTEINVEEPQVWKDVRSEIVDNINPESEKVWEEVVNKVISVGRLLAVRCQNVLDVPTGPAPVSVIIPGEITEPYMPTDTDKGGGFIYALKPDKLGPVFLGDAMTVIGDQVPNPKWLGGAEGRATFTTKSGVNVHYADHVPKVLPVEIIENRGMPDSQVGVGYGDHTEAIADFSGTVDEIDVVAVFNPYGSKQWEERAKELGLKEIKTMPPGATPHTEEAVREMWSK